MIKQNIFVAVFAILCFLGLWAIACAFIKMDVCSTCFIKCSAYQQYIYISNKDSAYIEKNKKESIRVEYEKQYFYCNITYDSKDENYTTYEITLPKVIPKDDNYLYSKIIIDTLNVYQYIIKK